MKYQNQGRQERGLQVQEDQVLLRQAHLLVHLLQVHQTHQEDGLLLVLQVQVRHPILITKVDRKIIDPRKSKNFVVMLICEKMSILI